MLKNISNSEINKAVFSFMSELTEKVGAIEVDTFCKIMLDLYKNIKEILYHSCFRDLDEYADRFSIESLDKRGKLEIKGGNISIKLFEEK